MADKRPIIIIKKKAGHGGHHGGAWKVAYADFVTAMMALFIVLWLTSSGEKVKKSIAGYFNDPSGTSREVGTDRIGEAENIPLDRKDITKLKERLQQQIARQTDLSKLKDDIEVKITPEGIRIELIESKDGTFFETGSAVLNPVGKELLSLLAKEVGRVPNRVSLEGHTDAQQYAGGAHYDNWELSTDRANAARRLMQTAGLKHDQLAQVRGFADQQPRVVDPLDPSNRRVTVVVHYLGFTMTPPADKASKQEAKTTPPKAAASSEKIPADTAARPAAIKVPASAPAKEGATVAAGSAEHSTSKGFLSAIPTPNDAAAWVQRILHRQAKKAAQTETAKPAADLAAERAPQ